MVSVADWRRQLRAVDRSAWAAFLDRHSGLPGPRGNTRLAEAVALEAGPALVDELLASGDEYRAMCAAVAVARRGDEPRSRRLSTDGRWRVREGVAIGLQLLGDSSPDELTAVVRDWAGDPHPLVRRAAVAAICEPRLLRDPVTAAVAIEVCGRATDSIAALPPARRREPDVRCLRQALGYGWSVAVAADPGPGLKAFLALDLSDPDRAWIDSRNRRKKRLAAVITS